MGFLAEFASKIAKTHVVLVIFLEVENNLLAILLEDPWKVF